MSNFWRVLADSVWFADFLRVVEATPFSEWHYQSASRFDPENCDSPVTRAVAFFVRCRQSLAGRMESFAPLSRNRIRRGMNEQASAWLSAVDGLSEVHALWRKVAVLNRDALACIRSQDGPRVLLYIDPPYLQETRAAPEVYRHEMTQEQHRQLLELITAPTIQAKVMISGYRSELYDSWLGDWHRRDYDLPNNSAGGKSKRRMVESVYMNFVPGEVGA